jgi:hypothetical protein
MRRVISVLGVVAMMLSGRAAGAQELLRCDFLTGGGYIINNNAKANFGVGGSCKPGGDEHGLWGHLQYHDHGTGLKVHWTTITGYFFCTDPSCVDVGPDIASAQPTGTRLICGTGRTNQPPPNDTVDWAVTATDNREPGNNDMFSIHVVSQNGTFEYTAIPQTLAGGNIQLHKPNKSTGFFEVGPDSKNCPAFVTSPIPCSSPDDCPGDLACGAEGFCCDPNLVGCID